MNLLCMRASMVIASNPAGPCSFEIHSDHLDWRLYKEDYDKQDDREKER